MSPNVWKNIAVYLATESGGDDLAFRFLAAAETSFERLAAMPSMGAARDYIDTEHAGVRMWRIAGFDNYLIFYRPIERGIDTLFGGRRANEPS